MLEYGTCCGCLSLRKECIVFGLVDLITQIPYIAIEVDAGGDIASMDLIALTIGTLLSGLLVYGAIMGNLFCLWLWIFVHIIRTMIYVMGLFYCVIALSTDAESSGIAAEIHKDSEDVELDILIGLVSINIAIYIFLIIMVYRYICQILDDEAIECENVTTKALNGYARTVSIREASV